MFVMCPGQDLTTINKTGARALECANVALCPGHYLIQSMAKLCH